MAMVLELHGDGPLLLVGCGNMGGAMLRGWLARGLPADRIVVQEPSPDDETRALLAEHAIHATSDYNGPAPALILMAVKPQIMDAVYPTVARSIGDDTVVLSVAAGKTIAAFEAAAPASTAVVRAIPNTPSAIGQGMTVCCANAHLTAAQRKVCTDLLTAIGRVGWVDEERLIDAATAVSGSGPAYVFLLAECLARAGAELGLPDTLARELAAQTIAGAGDLMLESEEDAAQLRRNVTSPNGTTQAALDVLMAEPGLQALINRAVQAADTRSQELAS